MLSHADRDLLAPRLEGIELDPRQILEVPSDPISHVYFVESGLVSVVGTTGTGFLQNDPVWRSLTQESGLCGCFCCSRR